MAGSSVLMYNCEGSDWQKLRNTLMLLRFRLRVVKDEQMAIPIAALALGKGDVTKNPFSGEAFTEPMVVLCNLHPRQYALVADVLRRMDHPKPLLYGMMTPKTAYADSLTYYTLLKKAEEQKERAKNGETVEESTTEETATVEAVTTTDEAVTEVTSEAEEN